MKIESKGHEIRTLQDWEVYAPPKSKKHWKEGRSAMECAKAWLGEETPEMPSDIEALLNTCDLTREMTVETVFPELQIQFDRFRGEARNADLAFVGETGGRKVAVNVEAKADEEFSVLLPAKMAEAEAALAENPRSGQVGRIHGLARGLFGLEPEALDEIASFRYQLLTAAAGALAYAKQEDAELAVLIVHVFKTDQTTDKNLQRNAEDYRAFVDRLRRSSPNAGYCGDMEGPFQVPGDGRYQDPVDLLIGKVETNLRT